MMLNMSSKFDNYQHSGGTAVAATLNTSAVANCSAADVDAAATAAAISKAERESIHSGQFMVSHFEAEEAQDDLDDGEVKMLDPEDPSLSKPDDPPPCMEVQLYVPRKVAKQKEGFPSAGLITSHLEIETSLTKLFKCMNLAYSQKLTSPKWNHFKGVRLRWKDKIRLNNVIWRCWHMQFIQKRRTPVCQFASPLDVDIHSNPQNVVLEGKYWKRQLAVIKAEYRKWRRNFKSQITGCLIYDTKSEFDFLEWSPLNDRSLMLSDDWTSDTLFSAINGPFPFPDPREIARGAGIADFIQPSLGPLQPNLDDIDLTFAELLQSSRLPPVPEEGSDDMLKNDYSFSAIMGAEQMDSSNIMDVAANSDNQMQNNDDANMMELNTPLNAMQFADIGQQFSSRQSGNISLTGNQTVNSTIGSDDTVMSEECTRIMLPPHSDLSNTVTTSNRTQTKHYTSVNENLLGRQNCNEFPGKSIFKGRIAKNTQRPFRREPHNYDKAQPTLHQTTIYQQMLAEQQKTAHHPHLQPNISSNVLPHQTTTFQQQQQQQQQHYSTPQFQQTTGSTLIGNSNNNNFVLGTESAPSMRTSNVNNSNVLNMTAAATSSKGGFELMQQNASNMSTTQSASAQSLMMNVKIEPPSSDVLSMFNLSAANDMFSGSCSNSSSTSNSYKPYPTIPNFKKSASTGTYISVRNPGIPQGYIQDQSQAMAQIHAQSLPLSLGGQLQSMSNTHMPRQVTQQSQTQLSPSSSQQQQQQQQLQQQQQQQQHHLNTQQQMQQQLQPQAQQSVMPKEMFRSNSLPLNVSLQKLESRLSQDNFAVPKYHAKSTKSRTRSNSMHHHAPAPGAGGSAKHVPPQQLAAATLNSCNSDPMLNSTLAQLLTTNSRLTTIGNQQSSSQSAISTGIVPMTTHSVPLSAPLNKPTLAVQPATTNIFISSAQTSTSTAAMLDPRATTTSPIAQEMLQRQQMHMKQQQKSPKKSTSLPTTTAPAMLHSPPTSKMLSYPLPAGSHPSSCTTHLSLSPDSFHEHDSPLSPTHSLKFPRDNQRRAGHIHAEQKRRYNIKHGFDTLHALIPQLQQNPNAKLSKAAMLQKGADHIKHLRSERNLLEEKMDMLRKERDALNNSLTHLHSILPANGAPVTRQGTEHVRQLYEQYVRYRSMSNWKFWILGLILEPLLTSYTSSVSSASMEELRRTAFLWIDQHCSLIDLRPAVSNKLKYLSMKTDILSDPPSTLKEEVAKAVHNTLGQHPNLHGN